MPAFRPHEGRSLSETRPGRRASVESVGLGDEVVEIIAAGEPPEVEIHATAARCHRPRGR